MPTHDFRCTKGHVHEAFVRMDVKESRCPQCGETARTVFLTPPRLDWMGMAQGANAGPEFVARFDKAHKQRAQQESDYKAEHGDAMRGAGS